MTLVHAALAVVPLLVPLAAQRVLALRNGDRDYDRLGVVLRAIGDVNGDGIGDVGAVAAEAGGNAWDRGSLRVLSGRDLSPIYRIPAPLVGGWFGASLAVVGDLNADGTPDFVIGSPTAANDAGMCELRSGRDGSLLRSIPGGSALGVFLGREVSGVGDVDADGAPDFAVTGHGSLVVRIFSGRSGAVVRTFNGVLSSSSSAAFALRPAGDVDLDGTPDILFGDRNANSSRGRVTVISGRTGGALRTLDGGLSSRFGASVAALGDVDRDGTPDFAVGAPDEPHPNTAIARGAIRIFSGRTGAVLGAIVVPQLPRAAIGGTLAPVGDLNGDGIVDLATGNWEAGGGIGAVRVYAVPSGLPLFELHGSIGNNGSELGMGLDALGDVNGDGLGDFVASASREDAGFYEAGGVRIVSGRVVAIALAVGTGCGASSQWPTLHATRPLLGGTFQVFGDHAPAATTAIVLASLAPLRSANLGLPGCDLFVDPVSAVPFLNVPNAGSWSAPVPLPAVPFLAGIELAMQAMFAPTAGPLGGDLSNGLRLRLGY